MTGKSDKKIKKKVKKVITIGTMILLLATGLGVGNYFALKKYLKRNVETEFETLRVVVEKTIMQTVINNVSEPSLQTNGEALGLHSNTNENMPPEEEDGVKTGSKGDPYLGALLTLVSDLNKTMSDEIGHLNDRSDSLNEKLQSDERKMKSLEDKVNHNGVVGPGPATASESKNQANKPKANQKAGNDPAKSNKAPKGQPPSEKHVYFSVALTKAMNNLGENHLIEFDKVNNNEGGGYNTKIGKFRAPVAGTYLFMFFVDVVNEEGKKAHVNLLVDGQIKASAIAEAWHDGQDMTSANAVITYVKKDQKVWIQTAQGDNTPYDIDGPRTTFTGVLMFS